MGKLAGERCDICSGMLEAHLTDFEFIRGGQRVVVEDVQADVCLQCGEKYIDAKTMRQIEQIIARATSAPVRYLNVPVYRFELAV
jgi:YgiT-type zinc finger domain-containing protein